MFLCGIKNSMYPCLYLLFHTIEKKKKETDLTNGMLEGG